MAARLPGNPSKPAALVSRSSKSFTFNLPETGELRAAPQSVQEKARIQAAFKKTKKQYADPDFPPTRDSLSKSWTAMPVRVKMTWSNFQWKRIDEICQAPIKVSDLIEPTDILQGELGDCYFLSALSAIAEFPHRIQKLFDTQEYEASGCYIVSMLDTGVFKDFIVDDYFPCDRNGLLAFSGPKVDRGVSELWVLLLEKAYAKRFGSYQSIEAGFTDEVLRDLTAAPCETVQATARDIWQKLVNANNNGFIITAATGDEAEQDTVNSLGLVGLHAYSVITTAEVPTRRRTEYLLRIRNPWGNTEWRGDWSDQSPLWTPELRQELGWENANDGSFWMRLEDFQEWFDSVTICRVRDDFKYSAVLVNQPMNSFKVFEVSLDAAATVVLSVTLPDQRHSGYSSEYPVVRITTCMINEQDANLNEFLGGKADACRRDVWMEFDAPRAGKLLVFAEVDWVSDFTNEFGFSVYSACEASINDVTENYPDALSFIYSPSYAKSHAERKELRTNVFLYEGERTGVNMEGRYSEGFLYHFLENKTKNLRATISVQFPQFDNLELMYPDSGSEYQVVLEPDQFATIVVKHANLTQPVSFATKVRKEFQEVR
jgi:calpain-15